MKTIESKRIDALYRKLGINNENMTVRNTLNEGTLYNKLIYEFNAKPYSGTLLKQESKSGH